MPRPWTGVFPAAITHFRDDQSLDLPAMLKHLDVMLAAGVTPPSSGPVTAENNDDYPSGAAKKPAP